MNAQSQSQPAKHGGSRPGAGRPVGSRTVGGRLAERGKLIKEFVDRRLGGADRVDPLVMLDVERVVDLVMAAQTARAELAAGKTSIDDVVKLENAVGRALQRLNLPERGPAKVSRYGRAEPVPTLWEEE
jgi:hypothetical protein